MVKIIKITVDTTHRWRAEDLQQVLIHVKTIEVSEAGNINNQITEAENKEAETNQVMKTITLTNATPELMAAKANTEWTSGVERKDVQTYQVMMIQSEAITGVSSNSPALIKTTEVEDSEAVPLKTNLAKTTKQTRSQTRSITPFKYGAAKPICKSRNFSTSLIPTIAEFFRIGKSSACFNSPKMNVRN